MHGLTIHNKIYNLHLEKRYGEFSFQANLNKEVWITAVSPLFNGRDYLFFYLLLLGI